MIKTKALGGPHDFMKNENINRFLGSHPDQLDLGTKAIEASIANYTASFFEYKDTFEKDHIDLAICDSFAISCTDAAIVSKIPVIITSTMGLYADFSPSYINSKLYTTVEPTTANETLLFRIYRDYYAVPFALKTIQSKFKAAFDLQRKFGLVPVAWDASSPRYNNIVKMSNNLYGIEVPRPHSPLFHMIGPVMQSSYPALDKRTADFLDRHQRVAYVAFGQHVASPKKDIEMVLKALLQLKQEGYIDGIIWARLNITDVPQIKQDEEDILLSAWSPQFAILQHASTLLFVTHGGVGSLIESLYNGKRVFVYPFFGDQPGNARAIAHVGLGTYMNTLGLKFDQSDYNTLYDALYQVAADPEGRIQTVVNQYKHYVQIRSKHAVTRGADLMEEVAFASDENGFLGYRKSIEYEIHWMKRYNLDIYMTLFLTLVVFVKTACCLWGWLITTRKNSNNFKVKKS
ncbi:hypothetical protein EDC96DRAFT_445636 [Choanephora cucurbitarum]|nr:hypothetical protein EDC96DRAFT_445636 [Choanephora cucurbitarum]